MRNIIIAHLASVIPFDAFEASRIRMGLSAIHYSLHSSGTLTGKYLIIVYYSLEIK